MATVRVNPPIPLMLPYYRATLAYYRRLEIINQRENFTYILNSLTYIRA